MRPGVVITAQRVLDAAPRVIHVVPLTRTIRGHASEVLIEADENNALDADSAAQCQHVRAAVSIAWIERVASNTGPVALAQIRSIVAMLLDL